MDYKEVLKGMKPDTRERIVLSHLLNYGDITTLDAFYRYNITRLSAAIYELRHAHGVPIACSKEISESKGENGRRIIKQYARYYIAKGAN